MIVESSLQKQKTLEEQIKAEKSKFNAQMDTLLKRIDKEKEERDRIEQEKVRLKAEQEKREESGI